MDTNLTLAHMTHNTAVIHLHQATAFPGPEWGDSRAKLPSQNSSETCITAACEIRTIAQQYLRQCTAIVSPQFCYCLFIAGGVLLGKP